MFRWLKKMLIGKPKAEAPQAMVEPQVAPPEFGTIYATTVSDVVSRFLSENPEPTPFGVHALIAAGATELMSPEELEFACEKIQEHGYQYPINPTLQNDLAESELLEFLRWQARSNVDREAYQNENTIRKLIDQFRFETGR